MNASPSTRSPLAVVALALATATASWCGPWKPKSPSPKAGMAASQFPEIQRTIDDFVKTKPELAEYFKEAHAYAIFPTVGKGGFFVGGAHGKGRVFAQGKLIGNVSLSQVSVGLQFGGQAFSEVIFFRDGAALERFKKGKSEFSARASAVAADAGVSADNAWSGGVAVFTRTKGGLMAEAAIGGQDFKYTPLGGR